MEWQHVDNSVYSLKTVKMWDGKTEFSVRYTYEGFGFQKMKCLCAYCYSANKSKPQLAPSSVRSLGSSVHDEEDTTAHAQATILITESFEGAVDNAGGSDFTTRGSEDKSKSSTSFASENTLRISVSSRSQLKRLSNLAKENGRKEPRSQSTQIRGAENWIRPSMQICNRLPTI